MLLWNPIFSLLYMQYASSFQINTVLTNIIRRHGPSRFELSVILSFTRKDGKYPKITDFSPFIVRLTWLLSKPTQLTINTHKHVFCQIWMINKATTIKINMHYQYCTTNTACRNLYLLCHQQTLSALYDIHDV